MPKQYFKIPYIGHFSGVAQQRVRKLINRFCKPFDIEFVYSTFKIKTLFNVKDPLPSLTGSVRALCTNFLVQGVMLVTLAKQADISPRACTSTCTRTDLLRFTSICNLDYLKILDSARTKYQVKLKESMYIKWEKLNQQVKHINLTLSL